MSPEAVHAILADLPNRATRVAVRGDGRETWRFRVDDGGPTYDLHFYPDDNTTVRKYLGGAAAAREFTQLQALQKLTIPATRVIANLKGLRLGDRKGDACIVVHDPDAVPFDALLLEAAGWPRERRLSITASLLQRLESLHREKMIAVPLEIHDFAQRGDVTFLAEAGSALTGSVDAHRLYELDQSTRHITTASERLRIWRHFRGDQRPLDVLAATTRSVAPNATSGDGWFGAIEHEGFTGRFLRKPRLTLPWSDASGVEFTRDDWLAALPGILDAGDGNAIKNDDAAMVVGRTIEVAGRHFDVIIKRPSFKAGLRGWYRSYRRSRAMRAWIKTWRMLSLGFACEVPLLVLEKKRALRTVEQVLVVERVKGPTLAAAALDTLDSVEREKLLYRAGRVLRLIERKHFSHWDAKATNWIVWTDASGAARPVLIDLDGVRFYRAQGLGVKRLLRAMREHPQIVATDLKSLEAGYRGPR